MKKYPKEIELLVYYAYHLTIPTTIGLVQQTIGSEEKHTILSENYGRKIDNFNIRLIVDGEEESIQESVNQLKEALIPYAKRVSVIRLEDTEFYPPTPYEELSGI
jgi:hypothetical protein